ncbi:MAG: hypothetical protein KTR31_02570, partial [Myxococcales bacterium]|nr:hypothetical protein [Myxococcales bacterium]
TTVLFVTTLLSRRRLVRAATEVRDTHHERIAELRDDGVLRLHISDERLADARFLLTLGRASD